MLNQLILARQLHIASQATNAKHRDFNSHAKCVSYIGNTMTLWKWALVRIIITMMVLSRSAPSTHSLRQNPCTVHYVLACTIAKIEQCIHVSHVFELVFVSFKWLGRRCYCNKVKCTVAPSFWSPCPSCQSLTPNVWYLCSNCGGISKKQLLLCTLRAKLCNTTAKSGKISWCPTNCVWDYGNCSAMDAGKKSA